MYHLLGPIPGGSQPKPMSYKRVPFIISIINCIHVWVYIQTINFVYISYRALQDNVYLGITSWMEPSVALQQDDSSLYMS